MASRKVTLKLDSKDVPLAQFKSMVSGFFDLIEAVGKEASKGQKIKWTVSVREGSQVVEALAHSEDEALLDEVVDHSLTSGLKSLEKGCEEFPRNFTPKAIKAARRLASHCGSGGSVVPISIHTGRKRTSITSHTVASADDLIGYQHQSHGSVEGRLRMLADSDESVRFVVYQKLYKRNVNCVIPEELVDQAAGLFRHRVLVSGRIQYDSKGRPISMRVSEIERLPENDELPDPSDLKGIFAA